MGRRFPAPLIEEYVAHSDEGKELDRRRFLKCMAWVGTGAIWTMSSGVLKGSPLGQMHRGVMTAHAPADCGSSRSATVTSASTNRQTPT